MIALLADTGLPPLRGSQFFSTQFDFVPVAMIGGVFRHSALVREAFYNELQILAPRVQVMPKVVDPVEGALRLARKAAGSQI